MARYPSLHIVSTRIESLRLNVDSQVKLKPLLKHDIGLDVCKIAHFGNFSQLGLRHPRECIASTTLNDQLFTGRFSILDTSIFFYLLVQR